MRLDQIHAHLICDKDFPRASPTLLSCHHGPHGPETSHVPDGTTCLPLSVPLPSTRSPVRQHRQRPTRNASYTSVRKPIGEKHLVVIVVCGEYEGPALSLCVWAFWRLQLPFLRHALVWLFLREAPETIGFYIAVLRLRTEAFPVPYILGRHLQQTNFLCESERKLHHWLPELLPEGEDPPSGAILYVPRYQSSPLNPSILPYLPGQRDSTLLRSRAL